MTKQYESIRSFAHRTRPSILAGAWDQGVGNIRTTSPLPLDPCCIGAKLAVNLDAHRPHNHDEYHYRDGIRAACKQLECNEQDLIRLLHACGLNPEIYPFSAESWNVPRETVWDRLAKIEALPAFEGLNTEATGLEILAGVREANHAFWRRHYGIDERELSTESVEAFWTEFEQALAPALDLESLLEGAADAPAPVLTAVEPDRAKVDALWADMRPRLDERVRS